MLILTRRVGEVMIIGDDVSVVILGVKGNKARLGITAPKDITIHREEIYKRILKERQISEEVSKLTEIDQHPDIIDEGE